MKYKVALLLKRLRVISAVLLVLIIVVYFCNHSPNRLFIIEQLQTDMMKYIVAPLSKRLRVQSEVLLVLIIVVYFSNHSLNIIEHGRTDRQDEI